MLSCVLFNNALAKNEFEILLPKGEQARFIAALTDHQQKAQKRPVSRPPAKTTGTTKRHSCSPGAKLFSATIASQPPR